VLNDEINEKVCNMVNELGFAAECFTSDREIPKAPNPLKFSRWIKEEIIDATGIIDEMEKKHNCFSVCGKGCTACCYQAILINEIDFRAMMPILDNLSIEKRRQISEKATEQLAVLEQNGITNSSMEMKWWVTDNQSKEKYFSLHLPCPFLGDENECIVYSVRPSICWTYRNYGNKIECEENYNAPHAIAHSNVEYAFVKRIISAYKNYPKQPVKLIQSLIKNYLD
jgi:Fe-S-cluster containining protein